MEALQLLLLSALLAGTFALSRQAGEAAPLDDWSQLKVVRGVLENNARTPWSVGFRNTNTRIINGKAATKGQFPYMAAIVLDQKSFCGGSILSTSWILTAAHCVYRYSRWDVTVGVTDRSTDNGVTMTSSTAHYSPGFKRPLDRDVAVIKLPKEITYTEYIQPTKLPTRASKDEDLVGKEGRISGWGRTANRGSGAKTQTQLRWTTIKVISNQQCAKLFGSKVIQNKDYLMCAYNQQGGRTCAGDSGSPFVLVEDGVQVGVHSFGLRTCSGASGMNRVSMFLDWISETTGVELP